MSDHHSSNHHFILPEKVAIATGAALGVLTIVTVAVAHVDLGWWNFPVAFLIATIKASLVALFFMCLKYDKRENAVIFSTSFIFLFIFITLTGCDLFFRGDVYVKKGEPLGFANVASAPKFKKPWVASPEILAHGQEQFKTQCVMCHGAEGHGDGPAAAALNPKPRNFTQATGWKNGRKPSVIFSTLTEPKNLQGMPSFGSLSPEDRWTLAHYVHSLGPKGDDDMPSDLAKIDIDPTKETLGGTEKKTLPVDFMMSRMATD